MNNVSFSMPATALLQSHFSGQSKGVYSPDFRIIPLMPFNFTGSPPNNTLVSNGTKVVVLPYAIGTSVQLIVERNTVGAPADGWVSIRFLADNPGELLLIN